MSWGYYYNFYVLNKFIWCLNTWNELISKVNSPFNLLKMPLYFLCVNFASWFALFSDIVDNSMTKQSLLNTNNKIK